MFVLKLLLVQGPYGQKPSPLSHEMHSPVERPPERNWELLGADSSVGCLESLAPGAGWTFSYSVPSNISPGEENGQVGI